MKNKNGAVITNCRITGINPNLFLAIEIKVDKSNPKNTTGEDIISYVGVSPLVSLRGKDDPVESGEEKGPVIIDQNSNVDEKQTKQVYAKKITSPEKESHFGNASEVVKGDVSIPHITSVKPESDKIKNDLKLRVKGLIDGSQKGGNVSKQNNSKKSTKNVTKPSSSETPSPSTTSSTDTSISSTDSSNIIILRGGSRSNSAQRKNRNYKGGSNISTNAPQTEVDIRLRELLEQSKPGKRGRFESTSSPMAGLCE